MRAAIIIECGTAMETEKLETRRELSTTEASQISGLSRNHIAFLLRQGKLEGRNFGHRVWVVYADSLERYMATPHKPGPKGPLKKPTNSGAPSFDAHQHDGLGKS
jgi:hypothetical protein